MKKFYALLWLVSLAVFAKDAVFVASGRGTPDIDGRLEEAAWRDSVGCGPFLLHGLNSFAEQQTTVRFLWDDECLYAAFKCQEAALDPVQNRLGDFVKNYQETDSDKVHRSDMVQLFIGVPEVNSLYDVIVSASGVVCDCVSALDGVDFWGKRDRSWQSHAKVAIGISESRQDPHWVAEVALPWSALGGAPKAGDNRLFLAARREMPFKEFSTLQAVDAGLHQYKYLGRITFVEKVPGITIREFPEFTPGGNVLKVDHTNSLPVHLNGSITYDLKPIKLKNAVGKTEGQLPFSLEKGGDFVFSWYLSQGSVAYYSSPRYKCHVSTRILEASLDKAALTLNGAPVQAPMALKTGVNELVLKAEAQAAVSLKVGETAIPYPDGWLVAPNGTASMTLLCEESTIWPNWHTNGLYVNRGGRQQLLYYPKGIPGKTVSDYTMTVELPRGITLLGASGYYEKFPLEVSKQAPRLRDGAEYTPFAIRVTKTHPYFEKLKSHQMIALLLEVEQDVPYSESRILYYASSQEAHVLEIPNSFPVHVIEPARGVQLKNLVVRLSGSWLKSMDSADQKRLIFDYMADAGITDLNASVPGYKRLSKRGGFSFRDWNFSCEEYIRRHPGQAQLTFDGKSSKVIACPTAMLRDPEFTSFLKGSLLPWHEKSDKCSTIELDFEYHVKDGPLSCYCSACIQEFARFARISPDGLTSRTIVDKHLPQWVSYCNHRLADVSLLFRNAIRETLPGIPFVLYSGYQSDNTKLVYGVDWALLDGIFDLAVCGYGRAPQELKETQECLRHTPLALGEIIYPHDTTQRIAPQAFLEANLMRRFCDATKGILLYNYPTMDGRSFLAVANVTRLVAQYEPFFTTGIRKPDMLKAPAIPAAEYEVLGNGRGDYLVVLMNLKDKTRPYSLEVELPPGKTLYDDKDAILKDGKINVSIDGFKSKLFTIK